MIASGAGERTIRGNFTTEYKMKQVAIGQYRIFTLLLDFLKP